MAQAYWNGGSGAWGDAGNWSDAGGNPVGVPNAGMDASVGSYAFVTGSGTSATLTLGCYGNLDGQFAARSLVVKADWSGLDNRPYAALTGAGATLAVGAADIAGGFDVSGGAAFAVSGNATFDTTQLLTMSSGAYYSLDATGAGSAITVKGTLTMVGGGTLSVADHASMQVRNLDASPANGVTRDSFYVDATAGITVGTMETAAPGTLTIARDGHLTITDDSLPAVINGSTGRAAPIVDDGAIVVRADGGGLAPIVPTLLGTGEIDLQAGARFTMGAGASTLSVQFKGADAELDLATTALVGGKFAPMIGGFAEGDAIAVRGIAFDAASYCGGVLSLTDHGQTVGALRLSGGYGHAQFSVDHGVISVATAHA